MFLQGKETIRLSSKKKNNKGEYINDESIIRIEFSNNSGSEVVITRIEFEHFESDDEEFSKFVDNIIKGLNNNKEKIINSRKNFKKLTKTK